MSDAYMHAWVWVWVCGGREGPYTVFFIKRLVTPVCRNKLIIIISGACHPVEHIRHDAELANNKVHLLYCRGCTFLGHGMSFKTVESVLMEGHIGPGFGGGWCWRDFRK